MSHLLILVVTTIGSVGVSSGFWGYMWKRYATNHSTNALLMGLAYDKICTLGVSYIERGWITKDEFEEFHKYLFKPYLDMGGNGVASRIMDEVATLPFRSHNRYQEIFTNKEVLPGEVSWPQQKAS